MIVLFGALLGAAFGIYRARRRNGKLADILLYAAIFAIIFALIGLFATIFIDRALS